MLTGGLGNDTYVTDGGDAIMELAGEGTDTVQSSVSVTLGVNLENLTLTGAGAINGTGNALANAITGNAAANILNGGTGIDTMNGLGGDDRYFIFNTTPNYTTNRDFLTDFVHGGDKFWMENAVFTKLGAAGALNPAFFRLGAAATEADDYLVYNNTTGNLYYDSNGAGAAVLFATLTTKPILSAGDFVVI